MEKMINRGAFSYIFSGRLSDNEKISVIVKLFKNKLEIIILKYLIQKERIMIEKLFKIFTKKL